MKEIAIYVEGGGDTVRQKSELRNGFDQLLQVQKDAARVKRLRWKLVPSGGRDGAFKAFINANNIANDQTLCVLLVDSEDELPPEKVAEEDESDDERKNRLRRDADVRRDHLNTRDKWEFPDIPSERVHLMVRCMETWIVADPETLARYYGKEFHANKIPVRQNLEDEPKPQVYEKLKQATKDTSKGEYAKIKHASQLLAQIDSRKIAGRCARFTTFTTWLSQQIADA